MHASEQLNKEKYSSLHKAILLLTWDLLMCRGHENYDKKFCSEE